MISDKIKTNYTNNQISYFDLTHINICVQLREIDLYDVFYKYY